jgi:two-component system sensor histidine kinase KdpD
MDTVDALEVLGSALVTIRQFAPDRIITKALAAGEAIVRADPSLLEQVFINLLQNAVVHTPSDTPIHVTSEYDADQVRIAVEDKGPGVVEESAELVFERFQQVPGHRNKGSGLGLSIARGFARTIGGDVRVGRRADGQTGARFEVSLPLIVSETAT